MTSIIHEQITENSVGELYKVSLFNKDSLKPIEIYLNNVKSIFGKESKYNNDYIKWCISNDNIDIIKLIEAMLNSSFKDKITDIHSQLCFKPNYPAMIETKIINSSSHDIIKHDLGEIITYDDIKKRRCNIKLILKNVSIQYKKSQKVLHYNLELSNIALINDK